MTRRKRHSKKALWNRYRLWVEIALLVVAILAVTRLIFGNTEKEESPFMGATQYLTEILNEPHDIPIESTILKKYHEHSIVAASVDNSAWVSNGRVTVIGRNDYNQCDTRHWRDIVAIALGDSHIVGLTSAGQVVFAGDNTQGQCDLDTENQKVISIAASPYASYAVLEDGTVRMCGDSIASYDEIENEVDTLVVAANDSYVVLLKKDGTLSIFGEDNAPDDWKETNWEQIVSVSCGHNTIAALDFYGNVHISGGNIYGQNTLNGTQGVSYVCAGGNFCLALLENGEVIGAGSDSSGQRDVSKWQNIKTLSCGYRHTIALTQDNTRIYTGSNENGQQE